MADNPADPLPSTLRLTTIAITDVTSLPQTGERLRARAPVCASPLSYQIDSSIRNIAKFGLNGLRSTGGMPYFGTPLLSSREHELDRYRMLLAEAATVCANYLAIILRSFRIGNYV